MINEHTPGVSLNTDITPEMRMLFTALGVDRVKCYECGNSGSVEEKIWDNDCMWFICPACKRIQVREN